MKKYIFTILMVFLSTLSYSDVEFNSGVFNNLVIGGVGSTEVTLTTSVDTYLNGGSNASTNYGTSAGIIVKDRTSNGDVTRTGLVKFDLSSIPGGSTINSVTLTVVLSQGVDATNKVRVFEGLRNWVEAEATWNIYSTGNSWTTAGARGDTTDITGDWETDANMLASSSTTTADLTDALLTFTSTSDFIDHITANIGGTANLVFHQNTNENATVVYKSSDHGDAATDSPKLIITYQ